MEGPNPITDESRAAFRRAADADDRRKATTDELRRWAVLLDSAFRVPGTRIRFGVDAILGLIPGLGDLTTPIFAAAVLLTGLGQRVPAVVQARMVMNAAIDMAMGCVPILGDLVDVAWKANLRNLALLERHSRPGVPPTRQDYVFVFVCLGLMAALLVAPALVIAAVLWQFGLV